MNTITLNVDGMHCEKCTSRIKATIEALQGVKTVECDLSAKTVTIVSEMSEDEAIDSIEELGFDVVM